VAEEDWGEPYRNALEALNKGDFDEVKRALELLGFKFVKGTDPNHWMYYHALLREDPHFRYPRNLYRGHGQQRSSNQIAPRDKSQAKQVVKALEAVVASLRGEKGGEK
jgi:hypothetical protein